MARREALHTACFAALFCALALSTIDRDPRVFASEGWQYLDLAALEQRYFAALANLHAQPPLLNAVLGLALKLGGPGYGVWLTSFGLACAVGVFALTRRILAQLALDPRFAYALLAVPQLALYARWFYEPIYCLLFVCMLLDGALRLPQPRALLQCCCAAALLSLTHSMFHPLLMLAFCAALLLACGPELRTSAQRPVLLACALALALPSAVLAKNVVRFSVPALSSWGGCNLSQTTGSDFGFSDEGFVDDAARPEIELYRAHKASGVPNYNNLAMIEACKRRQAIALTAIRAQPLELARKRVRALVVGEGSWLSIEYSFVAESWNALGRALYGPLLAFERALRGVPLLVLNQLVPALCFVRLLRRRGEPRERALALVLALYFTHTVIAYFANGFEQERMQLKFWILIALCSLACAKALWQRRFREVGLLVGSRA